MTNDKTQIAIPKKSRARQAEIRSKMERKDLQRRRWANMARQLQVALEQDSRAPMAQKVAIMDLISEYHWRGLTPIQQMAVAA